MKMNRTQPVLLSQPHLKGKRTLSAQIALRSFGANRNKYLQVPKYLFVFKSNSDNCVCLTTISVFHALIRFCLNYLVCQFVASKQNFIFFVDVIHAWTNFCLRAKFFSQRSRLQSL